MTHTKTGFTVATAAATLALTFAAPTGAGAQAETAFTPAPAAQAAPAPRFERAEIVQPLPTSAQDSDASVEAGETPLKAASLRQLVAEQRATTPADDQLHCLAGAVYFEARGEPLEGQLAVAKVVMNRAASGRFPSSYCGVVTQRAQFSFVRGGRIPAAPTGTGAWQNAVAIARIAHGQLWDSAVGDALYFHARHVNPSWNRSKLARATIESHIFYR